jgi:hypothetical protein
MTQAQFPDAFHLPIRHCGIRNNAGVGRTRAARAMLSAIERDPEVMMRLLADRAA